MAQITREEVRVIARDELRGDFDALRRDIALQNDANAAAMRANAEAGKSVAKALERLSLIVVGDTELRVVGLLGDVEVLKTARQVSLLERAKLSGIWIATSVIGLVVLRGAWYLFNLVFKTGTSGN